MKLNYLKFLLLLVLVLSLFTSCQKEERKNVLRWAADLESGAPYVFQYEGSEELHGYEYEIMQAIADELGMEHELVPNNWDGLIMGLNNNNYDMAINGLEITEDRKEVVNFSIPYYMTYEQLVVRRGEKNISNLSDLTGKQVGTLSNSVAERILRATPGVDVKGYESEANSYEELKIGRLDAVLIDHPVAIYYAGWNDSLQLVGQPIGEVTYGIAIRKNDTELLQKVNEALRKMFASGRMREILERYKMWNFMMAKMTRDPEKSNISPDAYEEYLSSKGKVLTLKERLHRYIFEFVPKFNIAALKTIGLSMASMVVAVLLGLMLALVRVYGPKVFSKMAIGFIEIIRGTPLIIQLIFIYYAMPQLLDIHLGPWTAGIIGLGVNYGAYEAENYRAGIFAVPKGQMEAALSLGMTRFQALRTVILPQAIRLVIPPMTNDFISLLKDSSLVSLIAIVEITKTYFMLAAETYDYFGIGILASIYYLVIGLPFVKLAKMAEKRFTPGRRKRPAGAK